MKMKKIYLSLSILLTALTCFAQSDSTFTDSRDSKIYKKIKVGNQTWMAQNLNFSVTGSCCYEYNNANCVKYGRLYKWEEAQTACPPGWHLPKKEEFDVLLEKFSSASNKAVKEFLFTGNPEGSSPLGGYLSNSGYYRNIGQGAYYWTSSKSDDASAWCLYIIKDVSKASLFSYIQSCGISIRCLKDN
jgi:uncharacterized protein (TIGR02145 family)